MNQSLRSPVPTIQIATVQIATNETTAQIWHPPQLVDSYTKIVITPSQANILSGMCCGHTNAQIATRRKISENTVRTHAKRLFARLGACSRAHAVAIALSGQVVIYVEKYAPTSPTPPITPAQHIEEEEEE